MKESHSVQGGGGSNPGKNKEEEKVRKHFQEGRESIQRPTVPGPWMGRRLPRSGWGWRGIRLGDWARRSSAGGGAKKESASVFGSLQDGRMDKSGLLKSTGSRARHLASKNLRKP